MYVLLLMISGPYVLMPIWPHKWFLNGKIKLGLLRLRLERLRIARKGSKEKEKERYLRFSFPVLLVSSRAIDNEEDDET